jgi:diaminohydroxyphosphoribosylaminopyrimidine deaminase/5-amino-6-(5-phosphoribosylamino)uracil reductase
MADPNPDVTGGGAAALRAAGLEVVGPVLEERCRRLNEVYLTNVTLHRPFVFLKLALSLDGRIATRAGQSRWITSEASRRRVHKLRDRVSAIMVGIGTVLADNPSLTTRLPGRQGRDPIRVVVDSALKTPENAALFNPLSAAKVIIGCRKGAPAAERARLEKKGALVIPTSGSTRVDLKHLLSRLYGFGITSILLEGGAELAWSALEAGVVDRCLFFYAPIIIGGKAARMGVGGTGIDRLEEAPKLKDVETLRVGPDILVSGRVQYQGSEED